MEPKMLHSFLRGRKVIPAIHHDHSDRVDHTDEAHEAHVAEWMEILEQAEREEEADCDGALHESSCRVPAVCSEIPDGGGEEIAYYYNKADLGHQGVANQSDQSPPG